MLRKAEHRTESSSFVNAVSLRDTLFSRACVFPDMDDGSSASSGVKW
jgi:hypothetical protein